MNSSFILAHVMWQLNVCMEDLRSVIGFYCDVIYVRILTVRYAFLLFLLHIMF